MNMFAHIIELCNKAQSHTPKSEQDKIAGLIILFGQKGASEQVYMDMKGQKRFWTVWPFLFS